MQSDAEKCEYAIRKCQRALGVLLRLNYNAHQGGAKKQREDVLEYARRVTELKKELLRLTGRCSPKQKRWPI